MLPFADPSVGRVGTRQRVLDPESSVWRRAADWMLDDPRFRVTAGHIGLIKAVSTDRFGPVVVGTVWNGASADLVAWRLTASGWATAVIAHSGDDAVPAWNGSLVLRDDAGGFTLWTPTGNRIFRFSSPDGIVWQRALAYRGPAWSLTGARTRVPGRELLVWRGAQHDEHSDVVAGLMPAGR